MPNDLTFQNLGAQPSPHDYRDHKDPELTMGAPYPPLYKTDISAIPVSYQRKIGICTANLADYVEYLYLLKTGIHTRLSRRFLYAGTKQLIDGNVNVEGSYLRAVLKFAYHYGIATELTVPTDTNLSHQQFVDMSDFHPTAWVEARNFKIGGYVSVPINEDALKMAIYKYGMLYARMELGKEWWTRADGVASWNPSDILPLRPPTEIVSGHAVNTFGYEADNITHLRNSWSEQWAAQGNGYFDFDLYKPTEAWTVTLDRIANDLPAADEFKYVFKLPLQRGQRSEEVKKLQIALMILGDLEYVQPIDRGFYGAKTQEAVFRFQIRTNIPLSWTERYVYRGQYFGAKSMAKLNPLFA